MKLVTYSGPEGPRLGALIGEQVLDLSAAAERASINNFPVTMQALIEAGESGLTAAKVLVANPDPSALVDGARLLAPLPRPIRLRDCCMFLEHMEVGMAKVERATRTGSYEPQGAQPAGEEPERVKLNKQFYEQIIYYNADNLHIYGPDVEIPWPNRALWADYELELACIIGKSGKDIDRDNASGFIFGYTIFNDWSARDIQIPFMEANLGPGEGKDFANGLGPCIVTADEIGDAYDLTMTARINGDEWSRGSSGSIHHRFEDAIQQFSRGKMLFAGEIIASGTVLSGCGIELDRKLNDGDTVELEIEKIGVLKNTIVFPA